VRDWVSLVFCWVISIALAILSRNALPVTPLPAGAWGVNAPIWDMACVNAPMSIISPISFLLISP
jgi:hypothetical protein